MHLISLLYRRTKSSKVFWRRTLDRTVKVIRTICWCFCLGIVTTDVTDRRKGQLWEKARNQIPTNYIDFDPLPNACRQSTNCWCRMMKFIERILDFCMIQIPATHFFIIFLVSNLLAEKLRRRWCCQRILFWAGVQNMPKKRTAENLVKGLICKRNILYQFDIYPGELSCEVRVTSLQTSKR